MSERNRLDVLVPSDADYAAYDGMHCSVVWRNTSNTWRCPGCGRTKREIMRYGKRGGSNVRVYGPIGWLGGLHRHCDLNEDCKRDLRFSETLMCDQCSIASAIAKRRLGLPKCWSYSPDEIKKFVRLRPHKSKIEIDLQVAKTIFETETGKTT